MTSTANASNLISFSNSDIVPSASFLCIILCILLIAAVRLSSHRRPPSWIFAEVKFGGISVSGTSALVSEPNFVRICAFASELWPFKWIFKMAAVRHLELLFGYPGPPAKFSCWPEAYVQISCQSDLYLRRYLRSNISQVWLKTPIRAPKKYVLGGFWPLNITFHHRDPKKALLFNVE